jgi:Tol biopolymer transport system component
MRSPVSGVPRALLGGAALFLALAALFLLATPRVVQIEPQDGSGDVSSRRAFQITFTHEMDHASVESRISFIPDVPGDFTWEDRTLTFQPQAGWPEGARVTLRLKSGASARILLPMLRSYTWSFQITKRRILYLWPESGPADLYLRHLEGEDAERLTQTEAGILDYSLDPGGDTVIYSTMRADGNIELRAISLSSGEDRLLYACPQGDHCQEIAHEPDGQRIAFERFGFVSGQGGQPFPGPSSVWVLDLESGDEALPVGDLDHARSNPDWSTTGRLAYYDDTLKAIALVDVENGLGESPFNFIPNDLGLNGAWSPDGQDLIYASIVIVEGDSSDDSQVDFYSHVYRMDVATGSIADLTGDEAGQVEDAAPLYSPDGEWIAFTRKYLDNERWTLGRQLWIMRADGSDPRQLTAEPNLHVSSVVWSHDTRMLTFVRKNQANLTQPIEIWVIGVDGEDAELLVEGGYAPQWVP